MFGSNPANAADIEVTLAPSDGEAWIATYSFSKPRAGFLFMVQGTSHHSRYWKALDPDVTIQSIAGLDTVVFDKPKQQVQFEILPAERWLKRSGITSSRSQDGGAVISSSEFVVLPFKNVKKVVKLDGDIRKILKRSNIKSHILKLGFERPHRVLTGKVTDGLLEFDALDDMYIYLADDGQNIGGHVIVDRTMNSEIRRSFLSDVEKIKTYLSSKWNSKLETTPQTVMLYRDLGIPLVWGGGVALDGEAIVMEYQGDIHSRNVPQVSNELAQLFAHEFVHIFQQQDIPQKDIKSSWMFEGTADLIELYVLYEIGRLNDQDVMKEFSNKYETCSGALVGRPDHFRGGSRSRLYDCGALLMLITDKAIGDKDIYEFWNVLAKNTGSVLEISDYYDTLRELGISQQQAKDIQNIVQNRIEAASLDSQNTHYLNQLKDIMVAVGLNPEFDQNGNLVSLNWR